MTGITPLPKVGAVELTAGDHDLVVTFYQAGSGYDLHVMWQGPGIQRADIPAEVLFSRGRTLMPLKSETFAVDDAKAKAGRELVRDHRLRGMPQLDESQGGQLGQAAGGCERRRHRRMSLAGPAGGAAQYDLRADQSGAIAAALKDKPGLAQRPAPGDQVRHAMAAMNCYACHNRGGLGGPTPDRAGFFTMTAAFDMGDEGRLPPRLTSVGAEADEGRDRADRLRKQAARSAGAGHAHADVQPRSPAAFAGSAEQADGPRSPMLAYASSCSRPRRAEFVGTKGMGCVNCHGVGEAKSLGMPAMNLSSVHLRLRPGWFHRLLENPARSMRARHALFLGPRRRGVPRVAGGTMNGQIDAIWDYLSEGDAMALPIGLQSGKPYELVPTDQPIVHRTFVEPGLFVPGKIGTRAILVGFPEMVHVAFDADAVRLAFAWPEDSSTPAGNGKAAAGRRRGRWGPTC